MKRFLVILLMVVPLLALGIGGCAPQPPESPKPQVEPLKIGLLIPVTGPFALWGQYFAQAFDVALDEINWEMGGRPVEWIVEDEGGFDMALALDKAKKLVEADKVEIMVGPFFGGSHFSVLPYTSAIPMVDMIYTQTARKPEELKNKYAFWMSSGYYDTGVVTGHYMYDKLGYREVTTIASDHTVLRDFLAGITDGFIERGGEVVQQLWPPPDEVDYTTYIPAMEMSDALVVSLIDPTATGLLFARYDEMGMFDKMPVVIKGGEIPPPLMPEWGDSIEGIIGSQEFLYDLPYPETKVFVEAYFSKYGMLPDEKANNAYCTIKVLAAALEATGGNTDPDVLRRTLLDLEYDLTGGKFYFDEGRLAVEDRHVCQVQEVDGELKWVILETHPEDKTRLETFP